MKMIVLFIFQKYNGQVIIIVNTLVMTNSGMEKTLKIEGAQNVGTMKVLQEVQCLRRLNSRF